MEKKAFPVRKGVSYEAVITAQSSDGSGICKIDGYTLFVKSGVEGDEAVVRVTKTNKNYGFAVIEKLIKPSSVRVKPPCPISSACGGCAFMNISYEKQLEIKQNIVLDAIRRIGGFKDAKVEKCIGMEYPYGYRNKAQIPIGYTRDKKTAIGFYRERSHDIVECGSCKVCGSETEGAIKAVSEYMKKCRVSPYDENTGKGVLRHIFTRRSGSGEVCVVIVSNTLDLPDKEVLISLIKEYIPSVRTIVHNINAEKTNLILGKINIPLLGDGKLEDTLSGLRFEISPESFYQINSKQTEVLYSLAVECAALTGDETVFDLYSGIGTISLFMAKKAKKVIGIEIVERAVEDARKNAVRNGLDNAAFYAGDVSDTVSRLYANGERADVVVFDPPRKGSDEKTLETILKMAPKRIVYVSCNPATLARDMKILCDGGFYRPERITPVDMFCHTPHVETVCQLVLRNPATHINMDVDVEELLQDKRSQATYSQIKEYVLEKHGLKVSQLNIAQVKRKYGIIERENYNKPKSNDSKQPNCTKEKEDAITEALKHFGMI